MYALSAAAGATGHALPPRRAFDRAVRAVHAAVPGNWLEDRMAGRTLMEPSTCIGGHGLPRGHTAQRAGENGFQFDGWHWEASMCAEVSASPRPARAARPARPARSEEHTSELQSLMRISYAGCGLQKTM